MPSWSQRRTVTSTSQYQGGLGLDIQEMGSRPTVWRTVLARPKDEPLKMLIFQTIEASTYEQAVWGKKTERKKPSANLKLLTSKARPSALKSVVGTMKAAKIVKVTRALIKSGSPSIARYFPKTNQPAGVSV